MSNRNIFFPVGPIADEQGMFSLEWQQWLQNPQFLSIILGTPIDVPYGGTGLTSGTSGGVLGFVGSTTMASSGELTADKLVLGGGAGATPHSADFGFSQNILANNIFGKRVTGGSITSVVFESAQNILANQIFGA